MLFRSAGFIPEVFGIPFTATFVQDLLDTHGAHILIYHDGFETLLPQVKWQQKTTKLPKFSELSSTGAHLNDFPDVSADDVAVIFHTSGTTGGRPKPVPQTHKWLVSEGEVTWKCVIQRHPEGQQHVFNNIGSFASIGAASCTLSPLFDVIVLSGFQVSPSWPGRAHASRRVPVGRSPQRSSWPWCSSVD